MKKTAYLLFFLTLFFLLSKSCSAATKTTVFLPNYERVLETSEKNYYYDAVGITIQRNIKGTLEKLYFLFADYLGTTRYVRDKDNTLSQSIEYYPFGKLKSTPHSSITNLYTGQKSDTNNLYYYHARYYDPETGHFISADKAEGPNRYAYVRNNPIMLNDPTGNYSDPFAGDESLSQRSIYQTSRFIVMAQGKAALKGNDYKMVRTSLNSLPEKLYQNKTLYKTDQTRKSDNKAGILDKIFPPEVLAWARTYKESGVGIAMYFPEKMFKRDQKDFNNTFVHELSHLNKTIWGEKKLMDEFITLRGWSNNETGEWENSKEGWWSKNISKEYKFTNPDEDFACLSSEYYEDQERFLENYGQEVTDFYARYWKGWPEPKKPVYFTRPDGSPAK